MAGIPHAYLAGASSAVLALLRASPSCAATGCERPVDHHNGRFARPSLRVTRIGPGRKPQSGAAKTTAFSDRPTRSSTVAIRWQPRADAEQTRGTGDRTDA